MLFKYQSELLVLSCDMIRIVLQSRAEITRRNVYLFCITVGRCYPMTAVIDNLIITDVLDLLVS